MGRKGFEKISQREYARRLGISNEAVSRAVKKGLIKSGWDARDKKIIFEKANEEWGLLHKETDVSGIINEDDPNPKPPKADPKLKLTSDTSFVEARRINEVIRAQIQAIELQKIKKELVNKEEVGRQLFSFGQQLRIMLMATADRVIDNVLASKNRAEAHNILTTDIHTTLENIYKEFNKS